MAIGIGIGVAVIIAAFVWLTVSRTRIGQSTLPPELLERRVELKRRLERVVARVPRGPRPAGGEMPDHPRAGVIEANILSGNLGHALREAESALDESPTDARACLLLGWVLLHRKEYDAMASMLKRVRRLEGRGPLFDFLEGRGQYEQRLRSIAREHPDAMPRDLTSALVSPFETFILQLERQQRKTGQAAVWIPSLASLSLDDEQITELLVEHFTAYYDSLDRHLAAVELAPGFPDALYHTARMALKVGMVDVGMRLMTTIEPLMAASSERAQYQRDLGYLNGDPQPPSRPQPPTPPGARRSNRLKVLN